jgi:D-3-phosphoglycerate dehydrogenase
LSQHKFRILVADPLSEAGLEQLQSAVDAEVAAKAPIDRSAMLEVLPECQAMIVRSSTQVDAEVIDRGQELRVVGRAGVGLDNVDIDHASRRGVLVMNTPGANATATAEHTFALLLALCRKVPTANANVQSGGWDRGRYTGTQLAGKTIAVVGLGRVGRLVAQRAHVFGMHVLAYDPYLAIDAAQELNVELRELDELLPESDFVSLHAPLTPETQGLLGARELARMKHGARLINCARGELIDETALAAALDSGRLAGAAIDVFVSEPPVGSPLLGRDDVVLTPHLGAATEEAQRDVSVQIVDQVLAALRDEEYRNAVNLPFVDTGGWSELRPWLDLAERLGRLVGKLADGRLQRVEVEARGSEVAPHAQPLSTALLKGLLAPISAESVNYINAPHLAADRGIEVTRSRRASAAEYSNLLGCRVETDVGERSVAGTLFHSHPRAVEIDGYHLDAPPVGMVLLVWNRDVPGVIGKVGTLLGEAQVNIAEWRLGRTAPGETALAFINLDSPASIGTLDALSAIEGVQAVSQLDFPA